GMARLSPMPNGKCRHQGNSAEPFPPELLLVPDCQPCPESKPAHAEFLRFADQVATVAREPEQPQTLPLELRLESCAQVRLDPRNARSRKTKPFGPPTEPTKRIEPYEFWRSTEPTN